MFDQIRGFGIQELYMPLLSRDGAACLLNQKLWTSAVVALPAIRMLKGDGDCYFYWT